ncbi:DinB family protein [Flavihumibacter sp. R14]|nr:DinB family protein [Flavihumibacter soli]
MMTRKIDRRSFVKTTTVIGACLASGGILPVMGMTKDPGSQENIHIIGPREGFSPQVGTLLSMMTWMRTVVLSSVENMTKDELDYLHDAESNTIGAMLLHLAATERIYQIGTFNWKVGFKGDGKIDWEAAMALGDKGRKQIKGNNLDYYINILTETRATTIDEFGQRDDKWLAKVDPAFFQNMPTNNYCKWFHVCEHESNHNGQIKWIKSRIASTNKK